MNPGLLAETVSLSARPFAPCIGPNRVRLSGSGIQNSFFVESRTGSNPAAARFYLRGRRRTRRARPKRTGLRSRPRRCTRRGPRRRVWSARDRGWDFAGSVSRSRSLSEASPGAVSSPAPTFRGSGSDQPAAEAGFRIRNLGAAKRFYLDASTRSLAAGVDFSVTTASRSVGASAGGDLGAGGMSSTAESHPEYLVVPTVFNRPFRRADDR